MVAGVDFGKMHRSTSLQSSKLIYDGKWKVEMFGATASSTKARRVWRGARRRGAGVAQSWSRCLLGDRPTVSFFSSQT